jgi:hypothetical protein
MIAMVARRVGAELLPKEHRYLLTLWDYAYQELCPRQMRYRQFGSLPLIRMEQAAKHIPVLNVALVRAAVRLPTTSACHRCTDSVRD